MIESNGVVSLEIAAEFLSQTTGSLFTVEDILDLHVEIPIHAYISRKRGQPRYSSTLVQAVIESRKNAEDEDSSNGVIRLDADVMRDAFERLPSPIAMRYMWEKAAHKEGVYILSKDDVSLIAANGETRIYKAKSVFHRFIGELVPFFLVDLTKDDLCVRKSQLVEYAFSLKRE